MKRAFISFILVLTALAGMRASDASSASLDLLRTMSRRISEQVLLYLDAGLSDKAKHLDAIDAVLREFERKDEGGAWTATIQSEKLTCLMRRAKVAVLSGDKKAAQKAGSEFQQVFKAGGKKLGPKWYTNGEFNIQLMVEFANDADESVLSKMKEPSQPPQPTAPSGRGSP